MDTIVIESRKPFALEAIRAVLSEEWTVTSPDENRLVVHGGRDRAYIYSATAKTSQSPSEYTLLVDYRTVDMAKRILEKIANDPALTVDDQFETILPGDEFVVKCRKNPTWDWRAEFLSSHSKG
jgi:hypothetical protein